MPKTIVTHVNPDLDAITSVWLLIRFGGKDFSSARLAFVPAGERLPGEDNNTVHVDTGLGEFDHHQQAAGLKDTCSAKLVYEWLVSSGRITSEKALERLVNEINVVDHFHEYFWPEPTADRYQFFLEEVLSGLKLGDYVSGDPGLVEFGMRCLDGILVSFKAKLAGEDELSKGICFETKWGKTVALETGNDAVMKLGLKSGYRIVARRDPETGALRIKAAPLSSINLSPLYKAFKKADPEATWFFHTSRHMILNGSKRNPKMRPSRLSLDQVIRILKGAGRKK